MSRGSAALAQPSIHCGGRDTQSLADPSERPSVLVQLRGLIDVVRAQARVLGGDAAANEDLADRPAVDAELVSQLVDRRPRLVGSDELLGLSGVELTGGPGSAWSGPLGPVCRAAGASSGASPGR